MNFFYNKKYLKKADKILKERKDKERYDITCINAGICPICGSDNFSKIHIINLYKCHCGKCKIEFHYTKGK